MNGKKSNIKRLGFTALILLCFMALPRQSIGAQKIAILLSDQEKAYAAPIATFTNEINSPVEVYNLQGNIKNAQKTMADIFADDTSLIFALGAKAAYVAKVWTMDRQEIPVIFAMVINWQRYDLLKGQNNMAGIASDVSPGTQLANMTMFSPNVQKIGVIYSKDHSGEIVAKAEKATGLLDLELIAKPISRPEDFQRTYKEFGNDINGFWVLADPVIYTLENISWLEKKCLKDNLSCIGQSENVAKFGMLLAVDPDMHSIGSQAAAISKSVLQNTKQVKRIGVVSPLGTKLFLNLKTAKKVGLNISPAAMELTTEIIDN